MYKNQVELLDTIIEATQFIDNNLTKRNKPLQKQHISTSTTNVVNHYGYHDPWWVFFPTHTRETVYVVNPSDSSHFVGVNSRPKTKEEEEKEKESRNSVLAVIGGAVLAPVATYMFANDYNKYKISSIMDGMMSKLKTQCLAAKTCESADHIARYMEVEQLYQKWNNLYGGTLRGILYPKITGVASATLGLTGLYLSHYNTEMMGLAGTVGSACWYMWNLNTSDEITERNSLESLYNKLMLLYREVYEIVQRNKINETGKIVNELKDQFN